MPTLASHQFQAGRHGGVRHGAGAPRGPRRSTLAWHGLIASLVRREVGAEAYAVMPRPKVLRLAARIFMCDGDHALAARAFTQASRLTRLKPRGAALPHARKPPTAAMPPVASARPPAPTTTNFKPPAPATPLQPRHATFRSRLFSTSDFDQRVLLRQRSRPGRAVPLATASGNAA